MKDGWHIPGERIVRLFNEVNTLLYAAREEKQGQCTGCVFERNKREAECVAIPCKEVIWVKQDVFAMKKILGET